MTLKQVTDIIDGKRVFGPPKEIEEVKNAKAAYALLEKIDPYSVDDLLKIHGLMVDGLTAEAGCFRTVGVGVFSGKKLVHAGLPHKLVPVEEIVRDRQTAYYRAISDADRTGDARVFIEFMLMALRDALLVVKRSVGKSAGKSVGKSVGKILELLKEYPEMTRERLAVEVNLSVRGVEKNLAQLKSAGRICRVGGRKGGHWEVVG